MRTHPNHWYTNGKAVTRWHSCQAWRLVNSISSVCHNGITLIQDVKVYMEHFYQSLQTETTFCNYIKKKLGDFSVLKVSFNMHRLSGYFLIQVKTNLKKKCKIQNIICNILGLRSMYFDCRPVMGLVLDSSRGDQWSSGSGHNNCLDSVYDQSRLEDRFAESALRHGIGLVSADELFLLHRNVVGICWRSFLY